ncbi:MAG: CotH kinase family protein [Lachnotalea sp.]
MKKIVLIVNIILLVIICIYFTVDIKKTQNVYGEVGTQQDMDEIEQNTTLTTENILQNLIFNGEELPFDTDSSTFYLPLSMEEEDWEYGDFSSGDEGVSILLEDDFNNVVKKDAIANNESFEFIAFTDQEYRFYHIVFTGLPIMNITINDGTMEDSAQIDMSLYAASTKSEWVKSSMANINVRGFTSKEFPKKGYKLELTKFDSSGNTVNNDLSLLNMRKDNDWILYAMYNDSTKIRDKLSIDIWNEFGAEANPFSCDFGTKLEYVELVVNGEYYGIYGLMEPVDAKKLDITASSEASSQEYIYKRKTSGYFLTLDEFVEDSDTLTRCGFELKGTNKYGDISLQSWQPMINFISAYMIEDDEEFAKEIKETIDTNSALNVWLYLQIVSGSDNIGKNMYFVSKVTSSGSKLYFVPWDLDLTWGNVSKTTNDLRTAFEADMVQFEVNWEPGESLVVRNVDNSVDLVKEKWRVLRRTILTNEALVNRIEALENTVVNSGAMTRDMNRWPDGGHTYDYSDIIQYATDKMDYLDSYLATLGEQ